MNTKDFVYSWHLSLRVDRPLEGCPMRPHAYMYGKKLDDAAQYHTSTGSTSNNATTNNSNNNPQNNGGAMVSANGTTYFDGNNNNNNGTNSSGGVGNVGGGGGANNNNNGSSSNNNNSSGNSVGGGGSVSGNNSIVGKMLPPHSKKMREPPPQHEFSYRWFRGPLHETCAYEGCRRRTSFSPHDWSKHAIGGTECALQCISTQSSLYKCIFCNSSCFIMAWKTQYTVPKDVVVAREAAGLVTAGGHASGCVIAGGGNSGGGGMGGGNNSRGGTPVRSRSASFGAGSDDEVMFDDIGSTRSSGSKSPSNPYMNHVDMNPGTPRGYLGGYNNISSTPFATGGSDYGGGNSGMIHHNNNNNINGEDWFEISRDHVYVPGPDDVGRKLKIEAAAYSLETGELLMSRVVKTDVVLSRAPDPMKRNLVTAKGGAQGTAGGATSGGGPRFRVATYNVLAEIYATQQQYPYCDFWALNWDYRFQNIMREIVDAAPDVVCLQEIQADHYENHVYAAMSDAGFEGVYKQKTRQSMGLAGKVDGCGLFWRRSKFHLVESYSIEFNEVAQRQATQVLGYNPRSEEGAAFLNRLSKDNVAQLVVLEFIQPANRPSREINQVCVANTHLYSNKDFPDVKLWQTWQLLQELESFIVNRGTNLPLIICGDFNSTPDTAVYNLLSRQSVHPGHPDVNVATGDDIPNILPDAMNITHSFQLGSSYHTVLGEEPWVTNYTMNFKGVLDYIWYSAQNIRPLSAAPIPDEGHLTKHGDALPSTEYSSDHIMLISDLQIITNTGR